MSRQNVEGDRFIDLGGFRLDRRQRELFRGNDAVPLTPKAMALLVALAEEPGRLWTKEELLAKVWPDVTVDESNLTQNIFLLRKAIGDEQGRRVVTVPRRGYRLVVDTAPRPKKAKAVVIAVAAAILIAAGIVAYTRTRPRAAVHSIAVLPFRPLDEHQGDAALELGIADTVINKLSDFPDVAVRPTRSITRFVDHPIDSIAAGRELEVDSVLEGTIQRDAQRLRCNVRLLRVADGTALWSDHFDARAGDLFDLEDQLAQRLADSLNVRLTDASRQALSKRYTDNLEAYQLYQQGYYAWSTLTQEGTVNSLRFYEAALQKDPHYALAWAGIAESYMVIGIYGPLDSEDAFTRSKAAAHRALDLDPSLSLGHEALGGVMIFHDWDWDRARAELQRAIALSPNSDAHGLLAYVLQANGKTDLAVMEIRRALLGDPLWKENQESYVQALLYDGRYDDAIESGTRLIALDPNDAEVRLETARALEAKGLVDDAAKQAAKMIEIAPDAPYGRAAAGFIASRRGDRVAASQDLDVLAKSPTKRNGRADYYASWIYAGLGDLDHCFASLEAAFRARYPLLWRIRVDPELASIRNDARYKDLLARMHLGTS